ncbi:MAG: hypothetical protein AAFP97_00285 [Pseudomonadota bacterium]
MRIAAILFSLLIWVWPTLAAAQESYPWMAKRAGDWTLSNEQGQAICTISFKPVGEFTLMEQRGKAEPKNCPEPYSELNAWSMPDENTLWLQKGWRTPVQTRDQDNDGIFEGRYGKKKDNIRVRLVQATGEAAGRATTPTVQGPTQSIEAPPALFHASELLRGGWDIIDANKQRVCTLDFQPRRMGQKDSASTKYFLRGKERCPEPFNELDLWETPKPDQIFLFNNALSRAVFRGSDPDRDGIYDSNVDGAEYRLVPTQMARVQKFMRFHQQAGAQFQWSASVPDDNRHAGVYIFQALDGHVEDECRVVFDGRANRNTAGRIRAGRNCPPRLRQSVRWSVASGEGLILEARDGSAMIAKRAAPFPLAFELSRYKGPANDKNGITKWHITKVFGPGALDVEGNPRRVPDLAPQNVIGDWRLQTAEDRNCRVRLERDGRVNSTCASFWSTWRVENGELIIRSSTQTIFFRGALSGRNKITNMNDREEILSR